ncbi:hypothetical protein CHARACLAT_002148 [Characodon lateralis]|uniref:Secreted protein n=1 Tax=Characodon lateralis TaxID=208331 RepID=A0ABU7DX76_9TELE|nr:hypothetical protein [Characodon lateralis]
MCSSSGAPSHLFMHSASEFVLFLSAVFLASSLGALLRQELKKSLGKVCAARVWTGARKREREIERGETMCGISFSC